MSGSQTLIPCCDTRTVGQLHGGIFTHVCMRPPFNEAGEIDGGNGSTISRPCQATDCLISAWLSTMEKILQRKDHGMHHERGSSGF